MLKLTIDDIIAQFTSDSLTFEEASNLVQTVKDIAANMDTDTWMNGNEIVYAIDLEEIDRRFKGIHYVERHQEDNNENLNFVEYFFNTTNLQ